MLKIDSRTDRSSTCSVHQWCILRGQYPLAAGLVVFVHDFFVVVLVVTNAAVVHAVGAQRICLFSN